jgi:hypothetical protein
MSCGSKNKRQHLLVGHVPLLDDNIRMNCALSQIVDIVNLNRFATILVREESILQQGNCPVEILTVDCVFVMDEFGDVCHHWIQMIGWALDLQPYYDHDYYYDYHFYHYYYYDYYLLRLRLRPPRTTSANAPAAARTTNYIMPATTTTTTYYYYYDCSVVG